MWKRLVLTSSVLCISTIVFTRAARAELVGWWTFDETTGSVDDFRIYNRVLSEAEVRYLAGDR